MRRDFAAVISLVVPVFAVSGAQADQHGDTATPTTSAPASPAPGTCGKPPSDKGNWRCISRRVTIGKRTNELTHIQETFQMITVTWTDGGKTMQDSWEQK